MTLRQVVYILGIIFLLGEGGSAQVWTELNSFQTATSNLNEICISKDNRFFIAGYGYDSLVLDGEQSDSQTTLFSNGKTDCFILETDLTCVPRIIHQFGGVGSDQIIDCVIKDNNNFVVTGQFQKTMVVGDSVLTAPVTEASFIAELSRNDTTPVWCHATNAYSGNAIDASSSGDVVVAGVFYDSVECIPGDRYSGFGMADLFIVCYDESGKTKWSRIYGGRTDDYSPSVAYSPDNDIYFSGVYFDTLFSHGYHDTIISESNYDQSFLLKLDSNGNELWKKIVKSDGKAVCVSLFCDTLGNVYAAGKFTTTLSIDSTEVTSGDEYSMFFVKISHEGEVLWIRMADLAAGYRLAAGTDDDILLVGNFENQTWFDSVHVEAQDIQDIFIASYSTEGVCNWILNGGCCRAATCRNAAAGKDGIIVSGIADPVLVGRSCTLNFNGLIEDFNNQSTGRTYLAAMDPKGAGVIQPRTVKQCTLPQHSSIGTDIRYYDLCGRDITRMIHRCTNTSSVNFIPRIVIRYDGIVTDMITISK